MNIPTQRRDVHLEASALLEVQHTCRAPVGFIVLKDLPRIHHVLRDLHAQIRIQRHHAQQPATVQLAAFQGFRVHLEARAWLARSCPFTAHPTHTAQMRPTRPYFAREIKFATEMRRRRSRALEIALDLTSHVRLAVSRSTM